MQLKFGLYTFCITKVSYIISVLWKPYWLQAMSVVASTLVDLVKNLKAFAGILVVRYFQNFYVLNSISCRKDMQNIRIVFYK